MPSWRGSVLLGSAAQDAEDEEDDEEDEQSKAEMASEDHPEGMESANVVTAVRETGARYHALHSSFSTSTGEVSLWK